MQGNGSTSLAKSFFKSKLVIGAIILNVVLVIIIIIIAIINASKTSTIIFDIAPWDANISVNGNSNYTNGLHSIAPGEYEITIQKDGLETKTINVNIEPDHVINIMTFLTGENNSFDYYKLKENYDQLRKLEEIVFTVEDTSDERIPLAQDFITEYNIREKYLQTVLPINYTEYEQDSESPTGQSLKEAITIRESKGDSCKTSLCIEVMLALTEDKEKANQLLESKGIKVDEYEIYYKTY